MKLDVLRAVFAVGAVAPYAGAWIETRWQPNPQNIQPGRPLRGGVD